MLASIFSIFQRTTPSFKGSAKIKPISLLQALAGKKMKKYGLI